MNLLKASKHALEWMEDQLDDVKCMEHTLDGHDPDSCVYCMLKNAIEEAEGIME